MHIDRYIADLRQQLTSVASGGGEDARAVAEQVGLALESATRLVLLEALSDAAGEITREIAPGSVELRLRGRDPEFAVSIPNQPAFAEPSAGEAQGEVQSVGPAADRADESTPAGADASSAATDDTSTSRTTLRLPDQLKARVERAAAHDGLSVNTWLVRAISDALEPKSRRAAERETRTNNTFTGWAR